MMCQDRLESVRRNVERILPAVDAAVIVDNGSTDGTQEWLRTQPKVYLVERRWNDSFVEGRNAYLNKVGELFGADSTPTIVCVADDDELYTDGLLTDLRQIAEEMYVNDLNLLRIRSQSVETDWKGDIFWSQWDTWHKPLLMLWEPGMRYVGIGRSEVHEDLIVPSGRREATLPDQDFRYGYSHCKKHGDIWVRGIRNFFAGGGGPNLGDLNPLWKPFKQLVLDRAGITTADRFVKYLEGGNVHADILKWFTQYRLLGTQFDSTPPMWDCWADGTSEVREGFLSYYLYFHPDLMPLEFVESDRAYKDYKMECRVIHGPASPAWAEYLEEER